MTPPLSALLAGDMGEWPGMGKCDGGGGNALGGGVGVAWCVCVCVCVCIPAAAAEAAPAAAVCPRPGAYTRPLFSST
jgi:hypothetical protein